MHPTGGMVAHLVARDRDLTLPLNPDINPKRIWDTYNYAI